MTRETLSRLSRRRANRPTRFRPETCVLEDRRVLSTITVSNDTSGHNHADYTTIQAAVNAAHPGDTVLVEPGTYHEDVVIPAGKDGLNLEGEDPGKVIIQAPPVQSSTQESIVRDAGSKNVTSRSSPSPGPAPTSTRAS
jgi:pectin methylesterase-like acyl-CoA thioesterase